MPRPGAAGTFAERMPTLFRLLVFIAIIIGLVYGAMFALVTFVEPRKGEMTERIAPERLNRPVEGR
jgi:hypothetical protein